MTTADTKLTAKLGEIASYNGKLPRSVAKELPGSVARDAWLVWTSLRRQATEDRDYNGTSGRSWSGSVTGVLRSLYPTHAHDEIEILSKDVRSFLRQTGNAVCVQQSQGTPRDALPVWWTRNTWNDDFSAVRVVRTSSSDMERKLTPEEVGEDRPPAPVEVRRIESVGSDALHPDWRREFLRLAHASPQGMFVRIVRALLSVDAGVELSTGEVAKLSRAATVQSVNVPLRTLEDMGLLGNGRRSEENRFSPARWSTTAEQQSVLRELLTLPPDRLREEGGDEFPIRSRIWPVLCELSQNGSWFTVSEVVISTRIGRSRVLSFLQNAVARGEVERIKRMASAALDGDGGQASWRVSIKAAAAGTDGPGAVSSKKKERAISKGVEPTGSTPTPKITRNSGAAVPSSALSVLTQPPAGDTADSVATISGFILELVEREATKRTEEISQERDQLREDVAKLKNAIRALTGSA